MLALRRLCTQPIRLTRSYASSSSVIEVTQDDKTGITILSMAGAPVNTLNTKMLKTLKSSLIDAKQNGSKGIILTSTLPTVFCAGLDIMEMYNRNQDQLTEFWTALQDAWLTLYGLDLPTAAAINGASPAGGCLLAMSCEHRVFVEGKHSIGLNETQLNVVAPKWFQDVYISTIGIRNAEKSLLKGTLYNPQDALQIGLVDELAKNKEDALKKCQAYISSFSKISPLARSLTKLQMRRPLLDWMKENRKNDLQTFVSIIQLPQVQKGLQLYIEYLRQKQ